MNQRKIVSPRHIFFPGFFLLVLVWFGFQTSPLPLYCRNPTISHPNFFPQFRTGIIITSLSDTESSPSSSPRTTPIILDLPVHPTDGIIDLDSLPASNDSTYHQPGPAGFTISPSFLSRLNKRQLESTKTYDFGFPANYQGEKGLIMYQPKPPPPPFGVGNSMGRERSQNGMEDEDEERLDLGARIEEIDDLGEMDTMEGTRQQSRGEDQMDLDMDMGLVDDVESMDIG
jgi:hypothetical protein